MCVCVCVCVHACVRACVLECVRVRLLCCVVTLHFVVFQFFPGGCQHSDGVGCTVQRGQAEKTTHFTNCGLTSSCAAVIPRNSFTNAVFYSGGIFFTRCRQSGNSRIHQLCLAVLYVISVHCSKGRANYVMSECRPKR